MKYFWFKCIKSDDQHVIVHCRGFAFAFVQQSVENLEKFRALKKDLGFDDILDYGQGVVILFHGISGTVGTQWVLRSSAHISVLPH